MFSEQTLSMENEVIDCRRLLHRHAELSFEEFWTTDYLLSQAEGLPGVTISRPTKTGFVAILKGSRPGRTIAFRADIDALPIQEETGLSFSSQNSGVMHACGHDGHAAMQLAALKILSGEADRLCGEVRFLFQHAEEKPPGGAIEMYRAGVMDGVNELYGLHLSSSFPTGSFGIREGALTSATDRFELKIRGSEGHSAFPELCVDPVVTAAEIILALQTIVSRKTRAAEPIVLSVCEMHAGNVYNVIPEEAVLVGATRTFSKKTREELPGKIRQVASGICNAHGAVCELDFQLGYASVINDPSLTRQSRALIEEVFGPQAVLEIDPLMPGEDFSALQEHCPAFFVELGAGNKEKGCTVAHHNRHYMMDEDALKYGVEYIVKTVKSRLSK